MGRTVIVVDADKMRCQELCIILEGESFRPIPLHSLADLEKNIQGSGCRAVLLDLDTKSVDNRVLRELKRKNPEICIVGLSERQFHPELKEAISSHIYACLGKPLDQEELFYWLNSIYE